MTILFERAPDSDFGPDDVDGMVGFLDEIDKPTRFDWDLLSGRPASGVQDTDLPTTDEVLGLDD